MGTSRRQRSKAEGSFLDEVKQHLEHLKKEISEIKISIQELRCPSHDNWFGDSGSYAADLNSWDIWTALGFDSSCPPCAIKECRPSDMRAEAAVFHPLELSDRISRETLLRLGSNFVRVRKTDDSALIRLEDRVKLAVEATSPPRLWGRRRPSAKVRRRRKLAAVVRLSEEDISTPRDQSIEQEREDVEKTVELTQASEVVLDSWEMILPAITAPSFKRADGGDYCFHDGSHTWPTKLIRDTFGFQLPANPALIEMVDANLFTGSAYRADACIPAEPRSLGWHTSDEDVDCNIWSLTELKIWIQVTARMANRAAVEASEQMEASECLEVRMDIIRKRWEEARSHVDASIREEIWKILTEQPIFNKECSKS